jgi:hypothetical protein
MDKTIVKNSATEDTQAISDIISNVVDKIKIYLKNSPMVYVKMTRLKVLYQVENSVFCGIWARQLYSINAKIIHGYNRSYELNMRTL